MKELNNPFVVYGYKGATYFCNRSVETEKVINGLNNERNITLIAPRRIGKTGLIRHVFARIKETQPDVCCIYFDILATKTLEQFVQVMARNVLGRLDTPSQAVLRKVQDYFSNFRPTMSFDSNTGMPTFSLEIAPHQEEQSLQRIFDYLSMSGKRCYIAIDEFQQITNYPESGTEALLRSFIQFVPNVYFIFAGSQQHMMSDMFLSPDRPFYQGSQIVMLGEIDESAYYDFAQAFFAKRGQLFPKDVFHYLYQEVEGQTWYMQATLNRVYSNQHGEIRNEDVSLAIQELIDEQEVAFENYYSSLTTNQSALLLAIAKENGVKSPMAQQFIQRYRLPALSSIKTALHSLFDNQFIYQYKGVWVVYDRFFGMWLRERVEG
ncbi:MAG: ATP-binding protein [Prevotella sp.]|nr:ATP-binding protein [Prevotella sp.]